VNTFILISILSSCDQFPTNSEQPVSIPEQELIKMTVVEEISPEPNEPIHQIFTPSISVEPSATNSPTQRHTWTPYPTKTKRPTWTPTDTLTTTATPVLGWLIKDDFSEDSHVWNVGSGNNWEMGYKRGGYYILVRANNVQITSTPTKFKPADVRINMEVYRLNGKGYWGITCRETPGGSYYTIFINEKGEYGYGETRNGEVFLNILGSSSEILTKKSQINIITAECRGENLRLAVEDSLLFQVKVDKIGPGWVGMMVGTSDESDSIEVVFDNIEIWGPVTN